MPFAMITSIVIFVSVYILIILDKIDKTIVVLMGAFFMLLFHVIPFDKAVEAVDLNVIFLLVGMMTSCHVLSKTGFFEWVAISVAKFAKGSPLAIMFLFLGVTALLSAFLDNVTTIILLAPITILITGILEISPVPFLILEAVASNIGGTATLIGDPPNILIGSKANLTFNDFIFHLTPVILIVFGVFLATIYFIFRKKWNISDSVKSRVVEACPHLAIIDRKNMNRALLILGLIFIGFFTHSLTGLEPGMIALCGSMIMVAVCRSHIDATFMRVEWGLNFFFIGLFMIIAGLEYTGVIEWLAGFILKFGGSDVFVLSLLVLIGSALFSMFLDNIPFVITMIPLIKEIIIRISQTNAVTDPALINSQVAMPLWWALALGACLGGNGSLIGASANLVMAKVSERNNYRISFGEFFKYGFPFMVQSIIICAIYIKIRYF